MDPNQTAMALLSTTASHGRGIGAISIAFSMEGMYGDGLNLYQYLGSNPWTNSDPLGLSSDPFAEIDAIIDEHIGSISAFASALGAEAASTAIIAARIASYLPFPGVGLVGDLALVALGDQSMEAALMGAAIGIIPGGKLMKMLGKTGLFKGIGRLGASAFKSAEGYAAKGGAFLRRGAEGIVNRAKRFLDRKPKAVACGCFTAATLVWTANGAVPIVDIEAGQQVLSAVDDGLSQDYSSNDVGTKIIIGEAALVQLHVMHEDGSTETINTTDEHPFHVSDTNAWTRADGLIIGDELSTIAGTAKLLGVTYTTERVPVYNLSIPGSPTYYVGERGVWVHNCVPRRVPVPFRDAQKATKGFKGDIQAHHLIEKRHFKHGTFSGNPDDFPGVVLTRGDHNIITNALRERLPYGKKYSRDEVRRAYEDVYAGYPGFLQSIKEHLK